MKHEPHTIEFLDNSGCECSMTCNGIPDESGKAMCEQTAEYYKILGTLKPLNIA